MDLKVDRELGKARPRREDAPLITGAARYTDDYSPSGLTHVAVRRSQYAHARIESIDTGEAEAQDGILEVFTAADLEESSAPGRLRVSGSIPGQKATEFPLLASDVIRYVGEPVAIVIAEDRYSAHDATGLIKVEYERLDVVSGFDDALAEDALPVHEQYDDNLAFDWDFGDADAVQEAFNVTDHVVKLDLENQRVHPDAMEPRAALAEYNPETREFLVRASTQAPHRLRARLAQFLGVPEHRIRVDAPATGGGFGSKGGAPYSEEPLAVWAAKQVERPVKWVATRSESHQADHHGRDVYSRAELAIDDNGIIRGLRVEADINLGAYLVWGSTPAANYRRLLSGQYDIPAIHGHVRGAFTNTTPIAPYRGAGRPEAIYVIERLIEQAAAEIGLDPVEFRRRNQIPPEAFPFETATGTVYDSGDYENTMDEAIAMVDYDGWRARQAEAREEDRYLGIGIASFTENTGTGPGRPESGRVRLRKDGSVVAFCGTFDHGQGHQTTFSQLLAEELGVKFDDVEIREGDTADLLTGTGTFGSRSAPVGGSVLAEAARDVIEQARRIAAHHLETSEMDVEFAAAEFQVAGVPDRSMHIREVAELAYTSDDLPEGMDGGLEAETFYDPENNAFSFGTHVAIVEVDPDSGEIDLETYVAVDDCGVILNPMIVEGQIHGGVAQGVGQALYEHAVYDENGTLLTGSLQDYALPKAFQIPEMEVEETVTPCPHNVIGAKGAGEGGSIAAPPAIVNAVVDALRPLGVKHVDMPLTNEVVWRAVKAAEDSAN